MTHHPERLFEFVRGVVVLPGGPDGIRPMGLCVEEPTAEEVKFLADGGATFAPPPPKEEHHLANYGGKGGSWQGKCGSAGDKNFEHTWSEGYKACKTKPKWIQVLGMESKRIQFVLAAVQT